MTATTPGLADYFIAKGKARSRFVAGAGDDGTCTDCHRKGYSYPDTCDQGWEIYRTGDFEPCANWTDRGDGLTPKEAEE